MQPATGILFRVCATFAVSLMGVLIKLVSDIYPTGELVFSRSFFAIFPIMAMLLARKQFPAGLSTKRPLLHLTRATSGVISMFCGFSALIFLPLSDTTAIGFAAPLFGVIFSVILLHEKVRIYRWTAVFAGLIGVLLIFVPHLIESFTGTAGRAALLGSLLALAGALLSAFSMTTVRRLTLTEKTPAIVFYFSVGATFVSLATLPFGWVMPTPLDAVMLISIGLLGGIAQVLLTQSYRYADASLVTPFDYLALLWAILFGWMVFSELPGWQMLTGGGIVIVAGIFVIYREHYHAVRARQERTLLALKASRIEA